MKFVDHRSEMVAFQAPLGRPTQGGVNSGRQIRKLFEFGPVEILEDDQHELSRCMTLGQLGDRSSAAVMANEQHAVKGWQRKDVAPSKCPHRGLARLNELQGLLAQRLWPAHKVSPMRRASPR